MVVTVNAIITPASFFGAPDGTIELIVTDGVTPYLFEWESGGDVTSKVTRVNGEHTVTVRDSSGIEGNNSLTRSYIIPVRTQFDLLTAPYTPETLTDIVHRDVICRRTVANGSQLIGKTNPTQAFYLNTTGITQTMIGSVGAKSTPDEDGNNISRLLFTTFDAAAIPTEVLEVTASGIKINGNLTVSGSTTDVTVNDIKVVDKTITLASSATNFNEIDGAGIVLGDDLTAVGRTLLYSKMNDTFVANAGLQLLNGSLRVGSDFVNSQMIFSEPLFKAFVGNAGIILDANGLQLFNAELVNASTMTAHSVIDEGLLHVASSKFIGYDSIADEWRVSSSPLRSDGFLSGTSTLTSTGLSVGTTQVSASGVNVNNKTSLTATEIELKDDTVFYLGNRNVKLYYDYVTETFKIDMLEGGVYVNKSELG